jgi:hypothetical protein
MSETAVAPAPPAPVEEVKPVETPAPEQTPVVEAAKVDEPTPVRLSVSFLSMLFRQRSSKAPVETKAEVCSICSAFEIGTYKFL